MVSLNKPDVVTTTVKWRFPAIHREGHVFVGIVLVLAAVSLFVWKVLTWPLLFLALCVAAFFRDPVRVTPQEEGTIVSPADGLVTMIERVPLPPQLAGPEGLGAAPLVRVSIFMSVFDVHINRSPIAGLVRLIDYVPGKFLNADLDKASEQNERQYFVVEDAAGRRVGFTQIAGLVARRIVTAVRPGQQVQAGERVGLIRFGSRVDVYLPESHGCRVALGQRAIAGETVLAVPGAPPLAGIAH